ncbi:ribonuclease H-like domain-containing protein [Tanacetum coccineum]
MDPYVTSTPNSTKLPILDTGKFEQWKFRIQQYLQHEHYALWEVIEFGDSYRAPAQDKSVSGEATPSSRSKGRTVAVTAEDMQKRRNDVKARTTLLLALPDEHQLRFSKYETAKELWEAILRTFGGNEATKKTKKNLLKQQYGNFKAEGSETLEQTFNRLQAIVSQLEFLDVPVEQEDLNQKFLTSLSPEWLMHTIVWRNRNDLDTMSLDDLYNHLKVYESEVQKKGGSSSQNMAFISSSNTNSGKSEVPTAQSFSTASGQVTTASTEVATATFSHDTICAYIATQQSGSQIKYEDITQIDDDDIEEMDIKWNMALLSMRADRFWKKTGKKITIQGSDVAGFDKSKVECFNCHKLGHFARECRAPRSQDRSRRESYKKEPKVEEPSHKAMMAIDGIGWDWSFMAEENEASENQALVAEEVVPTEFALMAMSSSSSDNEVYDDSYCSKSCRKNTENLTTKISKLREELFDSESDLCNYKRGLSQVEARLVEFKINESKFCEKIRVLERDLELKDYKIENLTNELEEVKKERDGIDSKLEKFVNSSKDLDQMLESQKSGKDKKGVGFDEYRAVPPPPAQVYSSPMPDLSWTGLPEFADNTVTDYTRPTPSVDVTNDVRSELDGNNLTVCEHGGTSSNAVSKPIINFVKESGCPNVIKINNIENARKPTAKYAELYRNITQSSNVRSNNFGPPIIEDWDSEDESDTESTPIESIRSTINQNRDQPRGNQRNWNNLKSQQLGKDFVMQNKACYKCGSFEHLKVNCNKNKWVNKGKNWSRVNYTQGNLTPKAILLKSGTKTIAPNRSFSTARTSLNVAQPKMKSFVKSAHSNVKRPFERKAVAKNKIWVPTVRTKNPTVGLKVPTAKPTVAAAKGNKGKAVKASARWIWKPKQISGEGSNVNGVSVTFKKYQYIDTQGRLKFTWTFFLKTKDETYRILRNFITEIENLKDLKVKIIRCDNGGEFRNKEMDDFCSRKEAARTMLADVKLPVTFWAEAVNTACYVQNRVLVTKPLNKTPYELFNGRAPAIGFLRPFGCHVMILNTLDHLGKFDAKGDEGFFVGYSLNSKAFKVYNKRTKHIEENFHINFLESKVIDKAGGLNWLFDIESLTKSMNYIPVVGAGTSSSNISGTKEDVKQAEKEKGSPLRFIALPNWFHEAQIITTNDGAKKSGGILIDSPQKEQEEVHTDKDVSEQVEHEVNKKVPESSGISFPTASSKESSKLTLTPTVETAVPTVSTHVPTASENIFIIDPSEPPLTPTVETIVPTASTPIPTVIKSRGGLRYSQPPSISNAVSSKNRVEDFFRDSTHATRLNEVEADLSNMETTIQVSLTPTPRIHKDHPKNQIIGPVDTPVLTRPFLSQEEPKKISKALKDSSWVEAMQEELLQTKCVLKNKKDERGIVIRNKARLVAQGHTQEEGIDYEEVFAPVARIEAIRLFLAYASYMGFTVYQMDVKSAFLYGTINEEVYVMQPPSFQDHRFPHKVYKVVKAMYGLHQAPRAWYGTMSKYLLDNGFQRGTIDQTLFIKKHKGEFLLVQVYVDDIIFGSSNPKMCREFEALMHNKFKMSAMGELSFFLGLQVLQKKDGIFLSQDKYVSDILKKFGFSDLRHQVTPKECHLHAVKRIFRYLKGHPKLGLWYPKESPFDLVAYSDSDYGGASQDRKSTTGGCQFLGRRLISWQCKKQTIVATSTTEAEYVAAASGCGQVLWIQNQLLDYGYNFMNTKIYIDNNSAICIVKNPVFHSRTKHIEIRHHFIRDCFEKKLIYVDHIHTDDNVADLLTKAFDVGRFQYLVVSIGMLDP